MADNTTQHELVTGQLYNIGNHLALREEIDPDFRVTKIIRSNLSVVDLIPVDYSLMWQSIIDKKQYAISYDFDTPISNYRKRCIDYRLEGVDGLRLWLTDDSQGSEEISNSFEPNIIETGLNKFGSWGQTIQGFLKSTNLSQSFGTESLDQWVKSSVKDLLGGANVPGIQNMVSNADLGEVIGNVAGTITGMLINGKQASLPKIWRQTDYNPAFTFNVKLVSPYGSPKAIKNFIIGPLVYLLLLAAPISTDGLTYGLYQPLKIKAYGISNINLGAITSLGIRRGGKETAYNVYKQPLQLDIAVNCMPLSGGFAFMGGDMKDIATMDDAETPYVENASGSPAFTSVGNMIQSLRPAPADVINAAVGNLAGDLFAENGTVKDTLGFLPPESRQSITPDQSMRPNTAVDESTLNKSLQC